MTKVISSSTALTTLRLLFTKITSTDVAVFLEIAASPGICFFELYQRTNDRIRISSEQLASSLERLLGSSRAATTSRYSLILRTSVSDSGYHLSDAGKQWISVLNERYPHPVARKGRAVYAFVGNRQRGKKHKRNLTTAGKQ